MKALNKISSGIIIFLLPFLFSAQQPEINYQALGKGRLIEKDGSIKKNIRLQEVHLKTEDRPGWITYLKDGSLHDMLTEKIESIEFPEAEQGAVRLVFRNDKVEVGKAP